MKHCSWRRYQELRMPPGRCGGGSSPRGLSNALPGHLKPWVQSSTPSRLATEKRNFSASDYDDARPAKLWNLCRRLAMTKISHLSFNAFTHLAQARVYDSDSSLLPKPCALRAFVLLCWPQMNSAHWRTAVIPSMLNVPSAKISQVGWVWGQLFPEGTPTREFPFPLQKKKSNIALNQPHRCHCTYMEPTDSVDFDNHKQHSWLSASAWGFCFHGNLVPAHAICSSGNVPSFWVYMDPRFEPFIQGTFSGRSLSLPHPLSHFPALFLPPLYTQTMLTHARYINKKKTNDQIEKWQVI